jgi:hypothetical protein
VLAAPMKRGRGKISRAAYQQNYSGLVSRARALIKAKKAEGKGMKWHNFAEHAVEVEASKERAKAVLLKVTATGDDDPGVDVDKVDPEDPVRLQQLIGLAPSHGEQDEQERLILKTTRRLRRLMSKMGFEVHTKFYNVVFHEVALR